MTMFNKLIVLSFLLFTISIHAENLHTSILTTDERIDGIELVKFPNNDRIYPDKSDFQLLHQIVMSNTKGERWVTLTIKNTAIGRRSFQKNQVLAIMADGSRRFPLSFSQEFKANEILSIPINFGSSQFPILRIETRL